MTVSSERAPSSQTRVVALITVAMFINYIDRGNLATAGPLLRAELDLSATQFGFLASAFFYSYVLAMAPVGWLAERFGAHKVLGIGVAVWSIATLLTGFANGFWTLLLFRLLLGLGESTSFPCSSKILAQVVPISRLGVANGIMSSGYLLGPSVGIFVGGMLMTEFGWRSIFFVFGALSLLWLIPWRTVVIAPPPVDDSADGYEPSFRQILRQRALWGAALGLFTANYGFYFILSWLPIYLVDERKFSIEGMIWLGSSAYLVNAICAFVMGWVTDRWIVAGRNPDVMYKGALAALHVGGIGCMLAMAYAGETGLAVALLLFQVLLGAASPGYYAIAQIIAGPRATGRWVGVQNSIGNVSGFLAPVITGILVDQTGGFAAAFVVASVVMAFGFVAWIWILGPIAPLRWSLQRV